MTSESRAARLALTVYRAGELALSEYVGSRVDHRPARYEAHWDALPAALRGWRAAFALRRVGDALPRDVRAGFDGKNFS
jgi:hypothetical protein